MSEEFRYIPYSPYDMNLKGLIKDGGVYNLKYAEASGKDCQVFFFQAVCMILMSCSGI